MMNGLIPNKNVLNSQFILLLINVVLQNIFECSGSETSYKTVKIQRHDKQNFTKKNISIATYNARQANYKNGEYNLNGRNVNYNQGKLYKRAEYKFQVHNTLGTTEYNLGDNNNNSNRKNRTIAIEGRIVGGDYASISKFAHSIFLAVECHDMQWICGASILTQNLLLTAAHCVAGCSKHFKIDAYAGDDDIEKVKVIRPVRKYIKHEKYDSKSARADIAIALLKNELPLGRFISRVIIRPSFPTDSKGMVAGWGVMNTQGESSQKLKMVKQVLLGRGQCGTINLKEGMMCAKSGLKDHRPAEGDSGSAFVLQNFQQIGIVSFRGKRNEDMIIYTNVSYFFKWINKHSVRIVCSRK